MNKIQLYIKLAHVHADNANTQDRKPTKNGIKLFIWKGNYNFKT